MIEYRALSRAEISKFVHLGRTETIEHICYARDESLVLEKEHWDVPDWSAAEKKAYCGTARAIRPGGHVLWCV